MNREDEELMPQLKRTESRQLVQNIRALKRQLSNVNTYRVKMRLITENFEGTQGQGVRHSVKEEDVELLDVFVEKIVRHALQHSLKWSDNNVREVSILFSKPALLADALECQFGNLGTFTEHVKHWHFQAIVMAPKKELPGSALYDAILLMFTQVLKTFYAIYWRKPLESKPHFSAANCEFQDPFYRQYVRRLNIVDPEIVSVFFSAEFNIKEFVLLCLKVFFPHEAVLWAKDQHEAHIYSLKLFLEMFEYGFWTIAEFDSLNEILHSLVLSATVYEKFITKQFSVDYTQIKEEVLDKYLDNLISLKKLIGNLYIHMLLLKFDAHVEGTLPEFGISCKNIGTERTDFGERVPLGELFDYHKLKRKLFYTYFGYSISTYLLKPVGLGNKISQKESLSVVQKKIVGFITQPAVDFYFQSLQTIHPFNLCFYLADPKNEMNAAAQDIQRRIHLYFRQLDNADLSSVEEDFLKGINTLFDDIRNLFMKLMENKEIASAYQTALTMHSVPRDLVYILYYLVNYDTPSQSNRQLMRKGAHVIADIISKNTLAASTLVTGIAFLHFKRYMVFDTIGGLVILSELFMSDFGILMLDSNEDLLAFCLESFSRSAKKFADAIDAGGVSTVRQRLMLSECMGLLAFTKLFKGLFKYKKTHRLKLEVVFMSAAHSCAKSCLRFFSSRRIPDPVASPDVMETKIAPATCWADLQESFQEYHIEEVAHQMIASFQHATKAFHYEEIQHSFYHFFSSECRLSTFNPLTSSHRGLSIYKNIARVFSCFMIFNRNATFYHRTFAHNMGSVSTGAYLSKEDLQFRVIDDIEAFYKFVEGRADDGFQGDDNTLFMNVYLPVFFKFLAGFLTLVKDKVLDAIPPAVLKRVRSFFDEQRAFLQKLIDRAPTDRLDVDPHPAYRKFLMQLTEKGVDSLIKPTARRKISELRASCKNCMILFLKLVEIYPHSSPETVDLIQSINWTKESKITKGLYRKLDLQGKYRMKNALNEKPRIQWEDVPHELDKNNAYRNRGQFDQVGLSDFQRESPWLLSLKQLNQIDRPDAEIVRYRAEPPSFPQETLNAVYYLKERYKDYRGFLCDNFKKNKVLYVINIQDTHTQNVHNIVSYFFMKFAELDVSFQNPARSFFSDNFYVSLIFLLDTMMQSGPLFREKLYEFTQNRDYKDVVTHTFRKIWRLNKALFCYLAYKSFLDETWSGLFRDFYLVSTFLQNLCEDNYVPFKDWFKNTKMDNKGKVTALQEFHAYIEDALLNNEVFASNDHALAVQDREEMFPIFCRGLECLTEFINGGVSNGAEILYYKRMDIFVGMFFRVIDDLDSFFYELKDNVVVYISALIEKDNPEIFDFIARNFSVSRTFALVKTLIKKLYVRQKLSMSKSLQAGFGLESPEAPLSDDIEHLDDLPSAEVLLEYYKKFEDEFSEHQLILICIRLFTFIYNMARNVSRYSHFIEEIELNVKRINELSYNTSAVLNDRESAIVWQFLKMITVQIEIEWPAVEDGNQSLSAAQEANVGRLANHIFQKKSLSFFLNESLQEEFLRKVKINSVEEKHADFFEIFEVYDNRTEVLCKNYRENLFLYYFNYPKVYLASRFTLMAITIIINTLLLFFYNGFNGNYKHYGFGDGSTLITIFTFLGVGISAGLLVSWTVSNYSTNRKEALMWYHKHKHLKPKELRWYHLIHVNLLKPVILHLSFIFYAAKLTLYLLGWFVSPIFFSLAWLLVIDLSETIKGVTMCFVSNYSKLAIGILLIMICVNIYAYILFDQYPQYFGKNPQNAGMCSTYFKCFLNVMHQGMINDQGIANVMFHVYSPDNSHFFGRFFSDVIYFIFITILLCDIIFGMVVDSYEEFKQELRQREHDQENVCFVCGLTRERVEAYNLWFESHLRFHDKWNYFFYYQFLKRFPTNDYNGVDIYVSDLLEKGQLTWLPLKRTQALEVLQKMGNVKGV